MWTTLKVTLFLAFVLAVIVAFCERASVRAEDVRPGSASEPPAMERVRMDGKAEKNGRLCSAGTSCLPDAKIEHPFIDGNTRWKSFLLK